MRDRVGGRKREKSLKEEVKCINKTLTPSTTGSQLGSKRHRHNMGWLH